MLVHELHIVERYVTTTYRSQELPVCIQGGYVSSTYPKYKIDALNVKIKFFILEVLVCCRRAWYVLQLREQLSTSLADVRRLTFLSELSIIGYKLSKIEQQLTQRTLDIR